MKPTKEFYNFWEYLFTFYNEQLFNGELESVMITITRKKNTMGYFSPKRWEQNTSNKKYVGELAMNPTFFKGFKVVEIMDTLVHEMCHVWQFQFGHVSKQVFNGYHNKAWVHKMIEVGLQPSHTGKPGGKVLGYQMNDYPIKGGKFLQVTELLESLTDFKSLWVDVFSVRKLYNADSKDTYSDEETQQEANSRKRKIKYSCSCTNIWGSGLVDITCNKCGEKLFPK